MTIDEARQFVRENSRAVMHTYRDDGSPQLSPVVVAVDDGGAAVVSTRQPSVKVANLRRDPRASLCVFTPSFFGPWVRIDGRTTILELPDAMEPLVEYYRRVAGEHDDWDDYRRSMEQERRVLVRIEILAAGPEVSG